MKFESVDALQKVLTNEVFHYAKDAKKAAGRALGTLVEIITFYLLKTWGYEMHIAIERRIPEYANPELTHNVEFTLHAAQNIDSFRLSENELPFTARKINSKIKNIELDGTALKSTRLLSSGKLLRNSCTLHENENQLIIALLEQHAKDDWNILINNLLPHPFAMFECKRVGVEDGTKKGPQTIEKAKQGAYVANSISSLQKIRKFDGTICGVMSSDKEDIKIAPYDKFIKDIIDSDDPTLLKDFILTVGVVSNHGNWFTSNDHNKELKVLAQSYDWLVFLTDTGFTKFVCDLLLHPKNEYEIVKESFITSYASGTNANQFTKVKILLDANNAIEKYFIENINEIESWFNVISPVNTSLGELNKQLRNLSSKDWQTILK